MVQPLQPPNLLIIKKDPFPTEIYPNPLKVTTDLHNAEWFPYKVRQLSNEANMPIHKVACLLISFALDHVKVEE